MHRVGIRELKNDASEVIRAVREERVEYVVTYHGRPVAIILPVDPESADQGLAEVLEASRPGAEFWARFDALAARIDERIRDGATAAEMVAEQRREL